SFEGTLPVRCAVHERTGLQINLRTGDPDLPAVAVRVDDLHGDGRYRGRLFVTGRTRTGALAGSTGEVTLELSAGGSAPASTGATVLAGSFQGTYGGEAGKGSVQGRFAGCGYALRGSGVVATGSSSLVR